MKRLLVTGASSFLGWNLCQEVAKKWGVSGYLLLAEILQLPKDLIRPGKQADIVMSAPRSPDTSLNSNKAFNLGYNPLTLREELIALMK